jgi:benzoate-CoA ligase family protein
MDRTRSNIADFLLERHIREGRGPLAAFMEPGRSPMTFDDLSQQSNTVARHLVETGVAAGDRVAILLPDCYEFVTGFFGILKAGAVAVPLNTYAKPDLLTSFLGNSRPAALLTTRKFDEVLSKIQWQDRALATEVIWMDGRNWASDSRAFDCFSVHQDDTAFILHTSGTTGSPKGAMHRHSSVSFITNTYGKQVLSISGKDISFSTSKLFFAYGLGNSIFFPMAAGTPAILNPKSPNSEEVFSIVEEFRPTLFFSVPTLFGRYVDDPAFDRNLFGSVRMCISAGEYLPGSVLDRWRDATGKPIYDGIGSTEALHIYCSNRRGSVRAYSSGLPVPGYELKIANEVGDSVPPGEIGELFLKGGSLASGYWNNPDAWEGIVDGQWLRTGDLYHRDKAGYYFYSGRNDDEFKVNGLWVSSSEVEAAILSQGEIREAVVLSAPDGRGLSRPKAFVVASDTNLTDEGMINLEERLKSYLHNRLETFKLPEEIEFRISLPRTATGKVARSLLRESIGEDA